MGIYPNRGRGRRKVVGLSRTRGDTPQVRLLPSWIGGLPHMRGDLPGSTLYSLAEAASTPCVWGRALGFHLAKATEGAYPTCVGIYPHCDDLR